ncbi:caspase family protein [Streptomyces sp. NPDC051211]|uniref:effector-associated domain 2-containing protein n=1 Tax=Streptomyces sp. NPDC051211 TaxID=3154643 RepID=UPI00344DFFF2
MTTPPPERVFALVVGIERYAAGPSWDLPGPARDALRFRDWLLARGVPERNILLHLAPTAGFTPQASHGPADHRSLRHDLVHRLPALDGDLLWVWWGGHGVLDKDEYIRLYTADATVSDKRNLDLESARRLLSSDAVPGFARQIWVVDACQTFAEEHAHRHSLPAEQLPAGGRENVHDQVLMLAADRGQRAANDPVRATGLFSAAVLDTLQDRTEVGAAAGPADTDALFGTVRERMAALRLEGHTGQLPRLVLHGPDRTEILRSAPSPAVAAGHPVPGSAPARRPLRARADLLDALLAYPFMMDPSKRELMVRLLDTPAVQTMNRGSDPRSDVTAVYVALRRLPGGLWLWYDAVTLLDPDETLAAGLESAILAYEAGQQSRPR